MIARRETTHISTTHKVGRTEDWRPFRTDEMLQLLDLIATAEVRPPRQVSDVIPRELERICLKALSKRAADRYTTAKDLADDLRHYLASAPADEKSSVLLSAAPAA